MVGYTASIGVLYRGRLATAVRLVAQLIVATNYYACHPTMCSVCPSRKMTGGTENEKA